MQNKRRQFLIASATNILWVASGKVALSESDKQLAERYYGDALTMLKNGHWYQRAIDKLTFSIKESPKNSDYNSALGCAFASRLASYCVAFQNRETLSASETSALLDEYRKKNPLDPKLSLKEDMEAFLASFPQLSAQDAVVLISPDDNRPFPYDKTIMVEKVQRLAKSAEESWETALSVCKTSEDKKSALQTRVWGMKLLILCQMNLQSNRLSEVFLPKQVQGWQEAMLKSAKELTTSFSDDADSWSLLGEALSKPQETIWSSTGDDITDAYRKALLHAPANPAITFRLYQIAQSRKDSPDETESYLREFVGTQKGNAYAYFCLASHLAANLSTEIASKPMDAEAEKQEIDKIITTVHTGILCSSYRIAPPCVAIVKTLRAAYDYLDASINPSTIVRLEFRNVGKVLLGFAKRQAETQADYAKKCCYTALAMSKRILVALDNEDNSPIARNQSVQVFEIETQGQALYAYKTLLAVLEKGEDKTESAKIEQERSAFIAKINEKRNNHH